MKIKIILFFLLVLISATALVFLASDTFNLTGNVILQSGDYVGDNLVGEVGITVEKGDVFDKDVPILILLTKNDTVVKVETLMFEEFVRLSGSRTKPIDSVYEIPETFVVNLEDVFPFTFDESGEYEFLFSVLELDMNIRKMFIVV